MTDLLGRISNVDKANKTWKRMNEIIDLENIRNEDYTDQINELVGGLENALYFKDQQEHEKWLDVLSSYKFWEDFEEITMSIIHREEDTLKTICESLYDVAKELAKTLNFKALFDAFSVVSGWTSKIENFAKWWESEYLTKEEKKEYLNDYKDIYEKDLDVEEIKKRFYGFEECSLPMFYEDNENGKSDLMECIFERYFQGSFYEDLPLLISFINELLNADLFQLLRTYKKAIKDFDYDTKHDYSTKGSLDRLQDVQADIYEWVEKNI